MDENMAAALCSTVGRRANSNVIRVDPAVRENLLYGHPDRRSTAPDRDDQRWSKTAFEDPQSEIEGIDEKILCADNVLLHLPALLNPGNRYTST